MKNKSKVFFILVIALTIIFSILTFTSCKKEELDFASERVYSTSYVQLNNKETVALGTPKWQEGLVGGNGKTGFITSCAPYEDTIIYQNIDFLMPTQRGRDDLEDISSSLEYVRQKIVDKVQPQADSTSWDYNYKFHPGPQLRLTFPYNEEKTYKRWTDYQTGEVGVIYEDSDGVWQRSTFTSRIDNVTITKITKSSKNKKINLEISIDDASKMFEFGKGDNPNEKDMIYKEIVDDDASFISFVAHYPNYENSSYVNGGYASSTHVISIGGKQEKIVKEGELDKYNVHNEKCPVISIKNAKEVYLITALDRTQDMGKFSDFTNQESYKLLDDLKVKCLNVANKYTQKVGLFNQFNYDYALKPSATLHGEYFNALKVDFGASEKDRNLSNEDLIKLQRNSNELLPAMLERVYKQGRYAMVCNGGYTMSRLSGMWTGEWDAGWRSIYTMDANVNLQSSGMNTSNMQFFGDGYINFVYKQMQDWITNAKKCYGFEDALLCPVNCDGDRALCAEYYSNSNGKMDYPFQYWNAGASWMIQPIYEYYQCYGNIDIKLQDKDAKLLEDVLYPLLTKNANFWQQMLTPRYYTDALGNAKYDENKTQLNEGEKFLIVPSYSPENMTGGITYNSTLAVNSAMDISAARYALKMAIEIEQTLKNVATNENIEKYEYLLNNLPNYMYDTTGAIKEWCANGYEENNNHRHISHLYLAWPAFETQDNEELKNAAMQAVINRNDATSKAQGTQSHGWLHKALVAARLKDATIVENCLFELLNDRLQYTSFMTDHNTDRKSKTYCTDSCYGLIGIVNEMLIYSNTGEIEALPALARSIKKGKIDNLMTRTRAVASIEWDETQVVLKITSNEKQEIKISCMGKNEQTVAFEKGETKDFTFKK